MTKYEQFEAELKELMRKHDVRSISSKMEKDPCDCDDDCSCLVVSRGNLVITLSDDIWSST